MLKSSQAAHIEASREVLRCPHCHLNQFMTTYGDCRKCGKELIEMKPEVPATPLVISMPGRPCGVYDICAALRIVRQAHGLSQRQLAKIMGCPREYISKVENRRSEPTIATCERYAQSLEIPMAGLLQIAEACAA